MFICCFINCALRYQVYVPVVHNGREVPFQEEPPPPLRGELLPTKPHNTVTKGGRRWSFSLRISMPLVLCHFGWWVGNGNNANIQCERLSPNWEADIKVQQAYRIMNTYMYETRLGPHRQHYMPNDATPPPALYAKRGCRVSINYPPCR